MDLAPRAIEEWDNEPLSLCGLCKCIGYHSAYRRKVVWHQIFIAGMSRPLSWWLSLLCLLTETVSIVKSLLSDSPWEHCLQRWAHLVSLVPWVQTALSLKPAEYFRLELVLLALLLMLSFLLPAPVFAQGVHSIFMAFQWSKAGMAPSACRLTTFKLFLQYHTHTAVVVWSTKSSHITPSFSSARSCCVYSL